MSFYHHTRKSYFPFNLRKKAHKITLFAVLLSLFISCTGFSFMTGKFLGNHRYRFTPYIPPLDGTDLEQMIYEAWYHKIVPPGWGRSPILDGPTLWGYQEQSGVGNWEDDTTRFISCYLEWQEKVKKDGFPRRIDASIYPKGVIMAWDSVFIKRKDSVRWGINYRFWKNPHLLCDYEALVWNEYSLPMYSTDSMFAEVAFFPNCWTRPGKWGGLCFSSWVRKLDFQKEDGRWVLTPAWRWPVKW